MLWVTLPTTPEQAGGTGPGSGLLTLWTRPQDSRAEVGTGPCSIGTKGRNTRRFLGVQRAGSVQGAGEVESAFSDVLGLPLPHVLDSPHWTPKLEPKWPASNARSESHKLDA